MNAVYANLKNRSKLPRKRTAYRAGLLVKHWLRRDRGPIEPVFVIATRRTGSNMLLSAMNSIPEVSMVPEILNASMYYGLRPKGISKKAVLRHIRYSMEAVPACIPGTKIVKQQLDMHCLTLAELKEIFPSSRFIVLYRKSIIHQFLSLKIAQATNEWQWSRDFTHQPIRLDPIELKQFSEETKDFYEGLFARPWLNRCSIVLDYEALTGDIQKTFDSTVFPWLGLPSCPIQATTRKQIRADLSQVVQNYGEIEKYLGHPMVFQDYASQVQEFADAV